MTHVLVRDIETRSAIDLTDVGTHVYAVHPSTTVRCVAYAVDDEPVKIWHPGDPVPKAWHQATKGWDVVAHNAAFDIEIERRILGPKFGFPLAPMEQQVCTMALALSMALPGALERVAKVLNLEHQKDKTGARTQLQMARPRRPRKGEDRDSVYFFDDPERHALSDESCMKDVAATRELYQSLPPLSPDEMRTWLLDQRINNRGFYLDQKLALAARKIAAAANPIINDELTTITGGEVTAFTQVARIIKWLGQYIEGIDSLAKGSVEELLALDLPDNARRVIELRLLGAQAAVAKVDALLQRRGSDGRVRGSFVFHAAGTGRWSSRGAQVHNLKRSLTEDIEHAVKIIGTGDIDIARKEYDNPLSVIGDLIRAMIIAAPGHTLIGGDFSGIEARVTAWIAGENSKLDVFRAYDEGRGPDPYVVAASIIFGIPPEQVTKEQRQYGKGAELAFGFQGGVKAFQRFLPSGTPSTASESDWKKRHGSDHRASNPVDGFRSLTFTEEIKNKWRAAHPNIVQFWYNVERAARKAAFNPGCVVAVGNNIQFTCDDSPFMRITLPSGRELSYPQIRRTKAFFFDGKIVEHERGFPCLLFKDNANGQWRDVKVYGGLLTENIVQGIARDLLRDAMHRLDAAGYNIITHVHDEAVIEVPKDKAEIIKPKFIKLMSEAPEWAGGLPIKVGVWISDRFTK
jgi:DNA polymerase bacteriophage-type